ncbi:hypothetical protein GCM10010381_01640 [Streptomyces xantholiticus]|nr:hypothetical protein GCM10010381_01640 [Streptomyces xantholiticus]
MLGYRPNDTRHVAPGSGSEPGRLPGRAGGLAEICEQGSVIDIGSIRWRPPQGIGSRGDRLPQASPDGPAVGTNPSHGPPTPCRLPQLREAASFLRQISQSPHTHTGAHRTM